MVDANGDYARAAQGVERCMTTRYRALSVLHESPQARTLLAEEVTSRQRLVVKVVRNDALTRGARTRLEHDAFVRHHITMDSVAPVIDYGQADEEFQVVMPFVAGVPLSTRLQLGPLSVVEALSVGKHVFSALRDLHQNGVLHRDIKPANIITNEGTPVQWAKLVDIGTVSTLR